MKKLIFLISILLMIYACSSNKKFQELSDKNQQLQDSITQIKLYSDQALEDYVAKLNELQKNNDLKKDELLELLMESQTSKDLLEKEIFKYHEQLNIVKQAIVLDTMLVEKVVYKTDTVQQVLYPQSKQGNATIFCPREMIYEKTFDVFALVSEYLSQEYIKEQIKNKIVNHEGDTSITLEEGRNLIFKDINFYEDIEITILKEASKGFEIIQIHDSTKQKYSENMEGWHWKVTPISSDPELELVFRVRTFDSEGNSVYKEDKTFKVKIKIRSRKFWANSKLLIIENPKWAITTLILPLLTFLWGRYQERRKRKKNVEGEERK